MCTHTIMNNQKNPYKLSYPIFDCLPSKQKSTNCPLVQYNKNLHIGSNPIAK